MKIILLGYGKMGKAIEQVINTQYVGHHEIIACIDRPKRVHLSADDLRRADIAIEFSRPEAVFDNLMFCFEAHIPVVCGTTGWLHRLAEVEKICIEQGQSLLYAANFSIGVQLFFALNKYLATLMKNQPAYTLQIDEIHHTEKLDAPSGTALVLANDIMAQNPNKKTWTNPPIEAALPLPAAAPHEIPILSYRQPDVKGTHIVCYQSGIDTLSISHTAHTRQGFAQGAVVAAEWLYGKKGVFTMKDVLGL